MSIASEDKGSLWWHNYPKNPRMNAHMERLNGTIRVSLLDYHEDLLFTDMGLFDRKLAEPAGLLPRLAPPPFPR